LVNEFKPAPDRQIKRRVRWIGAGFHGSAGLRLR
jgi:hypothetical protein